MKKPLREQAIEYLEYLKEQGVTHVPASGKKTPKAAPTPPAKPVAAVKEVPPIGASGLPGTKGFDSSIWFGIFAPKGTDPAVVQKLNTALREVLEQPDVRQRFESQGNTVRIETPEQFRQTVHKDRAKWAQVVKDAKISIN